MKTKFGKRIFLYWVMFTSFAVFFLLLSAGANDSKKGLRGEAFSDPSQTMTMEKGWARKPIRYEKEAGNADLVIVMDQDIYYTLLPLMQKFGRDNNLKIVIKEGTCGIVGGMLAAKSADMGGFCCPPGRQDRLPGLQFHTLGIVAKAFFVHPENPVDNVSTAQLREIYSGKIYRWSEIRTQSGRPGPDFAIRAIGRLHCPKRPGHWRLLLDDEKKFSTRLYEVGSIPDMIAQVSASKDAVGWEVLTMLEKYKNQGRVNPIKVDGYSPNDSNALASLRYPFYRTYTLATWEGKGVENKNALKLVDYMKRGFEKLDADRFGFVSASRLRKAGWRFSGDELVGEPK